MAPFVAPILRLGRALILFIMGIFRNHTKSYVATITSWAKTLHCPKKCRAKLLKSFNKSPWGRKLSKDLASLSGSGLIPKNVRIFVTKTLDGILGLLPLNTQILLNNFFTNRVGTFLFYVFIFRYLRLIVHLISFTLLYRPTPVPRNPTIRPKDVTVISPTLDLSNPTFEECLTSCLINEPAVIIIAPADTAMTGDEAHRRAIAHALQYVNTEITVLLQDSVFWPSPRFLPTLLAPFEEHTVGSVGTNRRVRRTKTGLSMMSFWNMLGALDTESSNFDVRATNAIDGGVAVVSDATSAHRSTILTDRSFVRKFTNERSFLGMIGPSNSNDAETFITRWNMKHGYKVKIQHSSDASPWSVYSVYISSIVEFALFYDGALIMSLLNSQVVKWDPNTITYLLRWILISKVVELIPYLLREPRDLLMLPGYFGFRYLHSFIKLYVLLTFWKTDSDIPTRRPAHDHNARSTTPRVQAIQSYPATPTPTPDRDWDRRAHRDHPSPNRIRGSDYGHGKGHAYDWDERVEVRASHTATPRPSPTKRGRGRPRGSSTPSHKYEDDPAYTPRSSPRVAGSRVRGSATPDSSGVKRGRGRPRKVI
ncbi:uncharacterized protein BDV17DRAFT_289970 [Aspergillus undulatus]|uniref:uncharacterized protein n=1 Tax=Aspergillus undulatus TaxID=1810928 RepID=UPI003CCDAD49